MDNGYYWTATQTGKNGEAWQLGITKNGALFSKQDKI